MKKRMNSRNKWKDKRENKQGNEHDKPDFLVKVSDQKLEHFAQLPVSKI